MTPADENLQQLAWYQRQIIYQPLGLAGQKKLSAARVLQVGVGGLGSWTAELLARAGVGMLRLVDDDRVDPTNLHRQSMYTARHAETKAPKVSAAAEQIASFAPQVQLDVRRQRLGPDNAESLAEGVDLILDGTDNFRGRFMVNDLAVKTNTPWVFAGVVGAEAQIMTIVPGRTLCLRCVLPAEPPPCSDPTCCSVGVLGPAVAAVASRQAFEAIKILSGNIEAIDPCLTKFDLWRNTYQRIDLSARGPDRDCPCCGQGEWEFLRP
ncbi:MAG: HesA/MoeB/ThiF family protein [Planctomycetota bacterium]